MKKTFLRILTNLSYPKKGKRILFTIILSLCFCSLTFSQTPVIDSLKQVFLNENELDTARVHAGYILNITYSNINIDSQRLYSNKFYELLKSTKDDHKILKLHLQASLSFSEGNSKATIKFLEEAFKINSKPRHIQPMLSLLASSYHDLGLLNKALNAYQKLESEFQHDFYSGNMAITLYNMGDLKSDMDDNEEALKLFQTALMISDSLKMRFVSGFSHSGIGSLYMKIGNIPEALKAYDNSIRIAKEIGSPSMEATAYDSKGTLYKDIQEYDKAFNYFDKALKIFEEIGDNSGVADVLSGFGNAYLQQGKIKDALRKCEKALKIYEKIGFLEGQIDNCECLYTTNKLEQNFTKALFYHEKWKILNDSVFSAEKAKEITQTELNFEFDKEKALLTQQKEADEAILKAETDQTRTAALGIGALALLALGFFLNARRNNKKIAVQNAEISEKNNQLEQVNQTKDRIFAIIGHDLRKPVVAFSGISETINYLIKKEDYATLQQLGGEIEKDGFALQKLTDNLLNWALTQRDVMPYNPQEIKLADKAEEILLIFEKVARDKNIDLVNKVPQGLNIFADPNSLLTILINLVDNALKYTPNGGRVEINAVTDIKGTRLEVTDTGVGIPKEQLKDIFLLQKDKSKKGTGGEKGTGLGLHLVNELVKLNQGEIVADSSIGAGTVFCVFLPQAAAAA